MFNICQALLLVTHFFIFLPLSVGGSVFGHCFAMQYSYLVSFLVFEIILTRKRGLIALL